MECLSRHIAQIHLTQGASVTHLCSAWRLNFNGLQNSMLASFSISGAQGITWKWLKYPFLDCWNGGPLVAAANASSGRFVLLPSLIGSKC